MLLRYPAIRSGSGTGNYSSSDEPGLNSEAVGPCRRLRYTTTSALWPVATKPKVQSYDDHGGVSVTLTNNSEDANDNWNNAGVIPPSPPNRKDDQRPEVDIHRFLGMMLDYYYFTHGHNGWDGAGKIVRAHAHNEYLPNNAFWHGTCHQIYFADGDGTSRSFMCPLDTVTHEFTHGVKRYLGVLGVYRGESGALDEATSELFGAFVSLNYPADDPWPWHHGPCTGWTERSDRI